MTTQQEMTSEPGVYFYATDEKTHKKLRILEALLSAHDIFSTWITSDWQGEKVQTLAVYAHPNVVAPYLAHTNKFGDMI
jgi:hypothetical protein